VGQIADLLDAFGSRGTAHRHYRSGVPNTCRHRLEAPHGVIPLCQDVSGNKEKGVNREQA